VNTFASGGFSSELMSMLESSESEIEMIHETLDDVGTCEQDGMCAVVGYVAYRPNWDNFNFAWKRTLAAIGIDYLHTSEYLYKYLRVGDHAPTDEETFNCLAPFIKVVQEQLLNPGTGFGVCVISRYDAYDQLTEEEKKFVRPPEFNSFELAIGLGCMRVQKELAKENTIAVQMDETQSAPELYKRYHAMKQESPIMKKYLGAICFTDDKLHQPVQAADMLGCLTLRAWRAFQAKKEWPLAFKALVCPTRSAVNVVPIVCGAEFLRGLVQLRQQKANRLAMPDFYAVV
jgi:hypothetical protein